MAIAAVEWQPTPSFVPFTSLGMHTLEQAKPLFVMTNDTPLPQLADGNEPDVGSGKIRGSRITSVTVVAIHTMPPVNIVAKILGLNEKPLMRLIPECRFGVAHGTTVGIGRELRSSERRLNQRLFGGGVSSRLAGHFLLSQHYLIRTKA